uniref:Uncharacterized protein n=1 Tax=viral metagenome TaxID=1070528 RepID=A0A6C0E7T9_9ZZZZ
MFGPLHGFIDKISTKSVKKNETDEKPETKAQPNLLNITIPDTFIKARTPSEIPIQLIPPSVIPKESKKASKKDTQKREQRDNKPFKDKDNDKKNDNKGDNKHDRGDRGDGRGKRFGSYISERDQARGRYFDKSRDQHELQKYRLDADGDNNRSKKKSKRHSSKISDSENIDELSEKVIKKYRMAEEEELSETENDVESQKPIKVIKPQVIPRETKEEQKVEPPQNEIQPEKPKEDPKNNANINPKQSEKPNEEPRANQNPNINPKQSEKPKEEQKPNEEPRVNQNPNINPKQSEKPKEEPRVNQNPNINPKQSEKPKEEPRVNQNPNINPKQSEKPKEEPRVNQNPNINPKQSEKPKEEPRINQNPNINPKQSEKPKEEPRINQNPNINPKQSEKPKEEPRINQNPNINPKQSEKPKEEPGTEFEQQIKSSNETVLYETLTHDEDKNKDLLRSRYDKLKKAYIAKHYELVKVFNGYRNLYQKAFLGENQEQKDIYWNKMKEIRDLLQKCQNDMKYSHTTMSNILPPSNVPLPITSNDISKLSDGKDVDKTYLEKHNELINIYKAYQTLYNKVVDIGKLKYKSEITRDQLDAMIRDQNTIVNNLVQMQNNLLQSGVLEKNEIVNVNTPNTVPLQQYNHQFINQLQKVTQNGKMNLTPNQHTKIQKFIKVDTEQNPKKINQIQILN